MCGRNGRRGHRGVARGSVGRERRGRRRCDTALRSSFIQYLFFSSRRRHTRFDCDWEFRRVLFRSVVDGTTVSDSDDDEKARQMSISLALSSFEWLGRKVNLIDTPGDPSFVADALGALRVSESAGDRESGGEGKSGELGWRPII